MHRLYLADSDENFEEVAREIGERIDQGEERFGIEPQIRKIKTKK